MRNTLLLVVLFVFGQLGLLAVDSSPVAAEARSGQSVTLTVRCEGTAPFRYQWYKDGEVIPGAEDKSLVLSSAVPGDSGSYGVLVSNSAGSSRSEPVKLRVIAPPTFMRMSGAAPKAGAAVAAAGAGAGASAPYEAMSGQSVTFTATCSGTEPFLYQWFKDDVPLAGAEAAVLSFPRAVPGDSGSYRVQISNSAGAASSAPVILKVSTPLLSVRHAAGPGSSGDAVAGAVLPGAESPAGDAHGAVASAAGPSHALSGQTVILHVSCSGSEPFRYQWYKDGSPLPGEEGVTLNLAPVTVADSGSYRVTVSNAAGSADSDPVQIEVSDPVSAPDIRKGPEAVALARGERATFGVRATGTDPRYQWYKDGIAIPGATGSTYSVSSAGAAQAGSYSVEVRNSAGAVTSRAAPLEVLTPVSLRAQPRALSVVEGAPAAFAVVANGSTPEYQWYKDNVALPGEVSATLRLRRVLTADAGAYSVEVRNRLGRVRSSTAVLSVVIPPSFSAQPQSLSVVEGRPASLRAGVAGSSLRLQWYKDGKVLVGAASAVLDIRSASPGDIGTYSLAIENSAGRLVSSSVQLEVLSRPAITRQPAGLSVVRGQKALFSVAATGSFPGYQWFRGKKPIPGATKPELVIQAVREEDAGPYSVEVRNRAGAVSSVKANLLVITPLSISSQPASVNAVRGQAVTFRVAVSGSSPVYQWSKDGHPIRDAVAPSYTISSAKESDAGSYTVSIRNGAGTLASAAAKLEVVSPVALTRQSGPVTVVEGRPVRLEVEASGTEPAFQWYKDGRPLVGATRAVFVVDTAGKDDAGMYHVRISNRANSVDSADTLVRVLPVLRITSQPHSLRVASGRNASFSVACNYPDATYQWYRDSAPVAGATQASLNLNSVTTKQAGAYTVSVSSGDQNQLSGAAQLTVAEQQGQSHMTLMIVSTRLSEKNPSTALSFMIEGSGSRRVLVRAVGPSLRRFGEKRPLADPTLVVSSRDDAGRGQTLGSNAGWGNDPDVAAAAIEGGTYDLDPGSRDAALVLSLNPGSYTVTVGSAGSKNGDTEVELYELP